MLSFPPMHAQINCRLPCSVVRAIINSNSPTSRFCKPVKFLRNADKQKPGLTALTIRGLSRSLSLSPRAKKTLSTIETTKISVRPYMSKDILTFAIHISITCTGLNPDFMFVNNLEKFCFFAYSGYSSFPNFTRPFGESKTSLPSLAQ